MEPQYMGRDSAPSYKYGSGGGGGGGGGGNKKAPVSDPLSDLVHWKTAEISYYNMQAWVCGSEGLSGPTS